MIITLYTKPDCSLCDEVKADLQALQSEIGFRFVECNIEDKASWFEKYRYLIPVVDVENGSMLYAPIYMQDLRDALESGQSTQDVSLCKQSAYSC